MVERDFQYPPRLRSSTAGIITTGKRPKFGRLQRPRGIFGDVDGRCNRGLHRSAEGDRVRDDVADQECAGVRWKRSHVIFVRWLRRAVDLGVIAADGERRKTSL